MADGAQDHGLHTHVIHGRDAASHGQAAEQGPGNAQTLPAGQRQRDRRRHDRRQQRDQDGGQVTQHGNRQREGQHPDVVIDQMPSPIAVDPPAIQSRRAWRRATVVRPARSGHIRRAHGNQHRQRDRVGYTNRSSISGTVYRCGGPVLREKSREILPGRAVGRRRWSAASGLAGPL